LCTGCEPQGKKQQPENMKGRLPEKTLSKKEERNGGKMCRVQYKHKERQDILSMLCLRPLVVQHTRL
jgi:hypothetical protein